MAPRKDFTDSSGMFGPLFTHLFMEYQMRGGVPPAVAAEGNAQLDQYFRNGTPVGVRLFRDYPETLEGVIVKFGKSEHVEKMLGLGEVRVTPSSFYAQSSLSKAVRDLESEREFHIPAFNEVMAGRAHATTKSGFRSRIEDGFVKEKVNCPDYVLWCACRDIDRRMPEDFGADAALIIKKPSLFASKFEAGLRNVWPGVKIKTGPVHYYDPRSFIHMKAKPVHLKHFLFAYQREWRLCAFPGPGRMPDEAFNIQLGSLADIAEVVKLLA